MASRILTALVGVPLLVGAIWLGFPWLTILVATAAILGLREFYGIAPGIWRPTIFLVGALWTVAFIIAGQLSSEGFRFGPHIVLGTWLIISVFSLLVRRSPRGLVSWAYSVAGPIYLGFLLAHALLLREAGSTDDFGRDWVLFALLVTFATDTGAYLTGRALGRHPMAPSISPGKTWEGAIGGFAWAVGIAVGLGALLQLSTPLWQEVLLGGIVGVVSQLGDLAESRLKRATGVKDTGALLPGHGGILDRLDSIVFTVPVVYYLVELVLKPPG